MDEDNDEFELITDPILVQQYFGEAQRLIDKVTAAFMRMDVELAEDAESIIEKLSEEGLSAVMQIAESLATAVMVEWIRRGGE
jgi:hypothetical protein